MSIDPFTTLSRTIHDGLLDCGMFAAIVKPTNFMEMTAAVFQQFKGQVQAGDLPEVVLLQTDFSMKPFGKNSAVVGFSQSFNLISTFDTLAALNVNQLKWATFVGLFKLGETLGLDGLVEGWEVRAAGDDAFGQKEWKRNTTRWVSHLTIAVDMYMDNNAIEGMG